MEQCFSKLPDKWLAGRRALVTGAATGIGAAIARQLAAAGSDVVVDHLKQPQQADEITADLRARGVRSFAIDADVSDPKSVAEMFRQIDADWGGIDILVNNAGLDGRAALAWQSELNDWRAVIEVNVFGAFYCAREALRRMTPARSGVIVNITSVHENVPWSGYSAYTASKAAVSMLTKTMAQEAARFGVRVLAVAPGAIKTDINRAVWSDEAGLADLETKIPMRRVGNPDEVARMVALLASDYASYVTGSTVFVDGGMLDYPSFAHGG
jgi:NAD(P)-dependent dehydrogenase (short-subunit alcohol dehydrogenase family)